MSCADVRLDEYMDGELDAAARGAVEAHLSGCPACREGLESSRRLERLLLSVPAGARPDADRFVAGIRARARRRFDRRAVAAAAAAAVFLGVLVSSMRDSCSDVRAALARFARTPTAADEARIRAAGRAGWAVLEEALDAPDVRLQFAAATLLFRLGDEAARERALARFRARPSGDAWTLAEPGVEEEDVELVPVAVSMAVEGSGQGALEILRKLRRLSLQAEGRIVETVVGLLKSEDPRVQRAGLDLVRHLDLDFPLTAVMELLDSRELGESALKILKEITGKDFGRDKQAWRSFLRR